MKFGAVRYNQTLNLSNILMQMYFLVYLKNTTVIYATPLMKLQRSSKKNSVIISELSLKTLLMQQKRPTGLT